MQIGDLQLIGSPSARLEKALRIIALNLHDEFGREPWIAHPDKSRESCVLSSFAVRDYMRALGFKAHTRPVLTLIRADRAETGLHSLSIGSFDLSALSRDRPDRWTGHMITILPAEGYIIDTTLYRSTRDEWRELPGMIAAPRMPPASDAEVGGLRVLSSLFTKPDETGKQMTILWLDQPKNTGWRQSDDTKKNRRARVVSTLVSAFKVLGDKGEHL